VHGGGLSRSGGLGWGGWTRGGGAQSVGLLDGGKKKKRVSDICHVAFGVR
jgi:hypothetical protein